VCFERNRTRFDPEMFNFCRFSAGNLAIFALSVHIFKRQQGGRHEYFAAHAPSGRHPTAGDGAFLTRKSFLKIPH
jgi:hypothetical protein